MLYPSPFPQSLGANRSPNCVQNYPFRWNTANAERYSTLGIQAKMMCFLNLEWSGDSSAPSFKIRAIIWGSFYIQLLEFFVECSDSSCTVSRGGHFTSGIHALKASRLDYNNASYVWFPSKDVCKNQVARDEWSCKPLLPIQPHAVSHLSARRRKVCNRTILCAREKRFFNVFFFQVQGIKYAAAKGARPYL